MFEEGYQAIKHCKGKIINVADSLVIETPLFININGEPFTITMQTPGDEIFLTLGLLYTEGIIKQVTDAISFDEKSGKIDVNLQVSSDLFSNKRSLLSVASCGICGKKELEELKGEQLKSSLQISDGSIFSMFQEMQSKQHTFSKTGGSHAAAIFDQKNNLLSIKEDIGRHNAVDKTIGECLVNKNLGEGKVLLVSGRVSYEIITKCFKAGLPILAAVSAPSTLAVDFAKELGISLLGFCRDEKFTIYSHPERVKKGSR